LEILTRVAITLRISSPSELLNFQNTFLGRLYTCFCSFHRIRAFINYIFFELGLSNNDEDDTTSKGWFYNFFRDSFYSITRFRVSLDTYDIVITPKGFNLFDGYTSSQQELKK